MVDALAISDQGRTALATMIYYARALAGWGDGYPPAEAVKIGEAMGELGDAVWRDLGLSPDDLARAQQQSEAVRTMDTRFPAFQRDG
jgi:hypothetical protein